MDMIERVARAIERLPIRDNKNRGGELDQLRLREAARAAIAIVIEDCALVAESESTDGNEWIVARIAGRIRSAPEDSATQAELERM